jgi:hypothetical protein
LSATAHHTPLSRKASNHLLIKVSVDPNLLRVLPASDRVDLQWERHLLEASA